MLRKCLTIVWVLALLIGSLGVQAQDDELRVLAIDYMGDALEAAGVYDLGFNMDVTVVDQRAMGVVVTDGRFLDYDIVLVDNQTIDPFLRDQGREAFIPICDLLPDLCPDPEPLDICILNPWLPICGNPCPPNALSCPPILWDVPIIIDPWDPMPWTLDSLIDVVESEQIMVDPRNEVGFFLRPAIFDIARPNLTTELDEAHLVFTPACNFIGHFDEFSEKGFLPIVVEGYQETPFNVGAYVVAEGNVEFAAEFAAALMTDTTVQMNLFEATGLLPGNVDVLAEVLPG